MTTRIGLGVLVLLILGESASAIMERGDYPWNVKLRSYYDDEMSSELDTVPWLLNLGPTGIRARIYPDKEKQLVVKYVFKDAKSPARDLIQAEDIIVGANGKKFGTSHRFGRNLPGGGGWDGPMMELAGHIEDSQGKDGILNLIVWPLGLKSDEKVVPIPLEAVGRFADTFPFNCPRSDQMLENLCDFMVMDYKSGNWKKENVFYGGAHGESHQMLALMASGMRKYDRIIKENIHQHYLNSASSSAMNIAYAFGDLAASDHALLARLVARYRPDDPEDQAIAAIYLEITGDTTTADDYFEKAGTEVREKLDALFE